MSDPESSVPIVTAAETSPSPKQSILQQNQNKSITAAALLPITTTTIASSSSEPELVAQTEFEEVLQPFKPETTDASPSSSDSAHPQFHANTINALTTTNTEQLIQIKNLQESQIILQNEKESELRLRISDQSRVLSDKDRTIENLLGEVDRRSDAIRSCGEEIVNLRRESQSLSKSNSDLSNRLEAKSKTEEREMKRIKQLVETEFSDLSSHNVPPSLLNQMRILTHNFQAQAKTVSDLKQTVKAQQHEIDGCSELIQQNKSLSKINSKQQKSLGKMGKLEDKLVAYKSTIAMQEKVISKLELVIESRMKEEARRGPAAWAKRQIEDRQKSDMLQEELDKNSAELEDLKNDSQNRVEFLESRIEGLESKNVEVEELLEEAKAIPKEDPAQVQKIDKLERDLNSWKETARNNAISQQETISKLRIKIFELEHKIDSSDDDDSDDGNNTVSTIGRMSLSNGSNRSNVNSLASLEKVVPEPARLESLVEPLK